MEEKQNFVPLRIRATTVRKRTIDPTGKLAKNDSPVFSAALSAESLYDPPVAFSTTTNGTTGLLVASDSTETAWAQVLDAKGLPTGHPMEGSCIPEEGWIGQE